MAPATARGDNRGMSEQKTSKAGAIPPAVAPIADGSSGAFAGAARAPAPAVPVYDSVDECGDASFPASDPPSWWSGH
jgi:hypothetical protein